MYKKLRIVKVDSLYCDYLRKYDNKVSYNAGTKDLRPFIGVLFTIVSVSTLLLYLHQSQSIKV